MATMPFTAPTIPPPTLFPKQSATGLYVVYNLIDFTAKTVIGCGYLLFDVTFAYVAGGVNVDFSNEQLKTTSPPLQVILQGMGPGPLLYKVTYPQFPPGAGVVNWQLLKMQGYTGSAELTPTGIPTTEIIRFTAIFPRI